MVTANDNKVLLSLEDLKVYFHSEDTISRAVDRVSYYVREGETVCLVGESGCGKTVSALTVLGLIPRPPGEIRGGRVIFQGLDLLTLPEAEMRKIRGGRIAMVFQEPMTSLNPVFTIGEQIAETIQAHEKRSDQEIRKMCVQLLKDVGVPDPEMRLGNYPHELSGGQRQRVMIAMALACNPELIIADEPTTALDVTIQAQILRLFAELKAKRGMSLLYITHDLGVVADIADRIYVMYAGCIAEEGERSHIFDDPRHPYTQGLLASLPNRTRRGEGLQSIPGAVPDPAYKPEGCPFNPRCPYAIERCRKEYPELCDYGKGHKARCPVLYGTWGE